ncbi:MAG: virulence RhuM family protein [Alphaproteobacteria bacterium]|nr:virulence RhuM family protein [Alphaproteobacteria bacterium]
MVGKEPTQIETPFLLYGDGDKKVHLRVFLQNETLWLSQVEIANFFDTTKQNISLHLKNIYREDELTPAATVKDFSMVQNEGKRAVRRNVKFYNLDAIIAVGYRVNSKQATRFRIWATQTLKDFIIKGFVMDDERLKQGKHIFGQDYFEELLERVRSIRTSERRVYQKITDIFAEISIDYNAQSDLAKNFYTIVQNKFYFAITGRTASEIIDDKANRSAPNMGLVSWKNAPEGRILSNDAQDPKNYLTKEELEQLKRALSAFFDHIESVIKNRTTMSMQDLSGRIDKFLNFMEYDVLDDECRINKNLADNKALQEYSDFNKTQKIISDFDKQIAKINEGER